MTDRIIYLAGEHDRNLRGPDRPCLDSIEIDGEGYPCCRHAEHLGPHVTTRERPNRFDIPDLSIEVHAIWETTDD